MTTTISPSEQAAMLPETIALRFACPMPGIEEHTRFTLIAIDDGPVYWLQCDDEPEMALPVADAFLIAPDYAFELSDNDARALSLTHREDALVLAVLTVPLGKGTVTANLLAPIVVNRREWIARQVILDGSRHSLRHPVMET